MDGQDWGIAIGNAIQAGFGGYNAHKARELDERKLQRTYEIQRLQEEVRLMIAKLEEGGRNARFDAEEGGRNTRHRQTIDQQGREEDGRNNRNSADILSREMVAWGDRDQRDAANRRTVDASRYNTDRDYAASIHATDTASADRADALDQAWALGVLGNQTTRRGQDVSRWNTRQRQNDPFAGLDDDAIVSDNVAAPTFDPYAFDDSAYALPEAPPPRRTRSAGSGRTPAAAQAARPSVSLPPMRPMASHRSGAPAGDGLAAVGIEPTGAAAAGAMNLDDLIGAPRPATPRFITRAQLEGVARLKGTTVEQERARAAAEGFVVR